MSPFQSSRILIADDDRSVRSYLCTVLRDAGYLPLQADDGQTALLMLNRMSIDLLVLDVGLPDTHGLEILREVKRRWADLPVVLITGMATIDCAVEAIREGAVEYLSKPFRTDILLWIITRALEARSRMLQATPPARLRVLVPLGAVPQHARQESGHSGEIATLAPLPQPTIVLAPVLPSPPPPTKQVETPPAPKVSCRQACYYCRCHALFPSKPRHWEWLLKLLLFRPLRCEVCSRRQWCWA